MKKPVLVLLYAFAVATVLPMAATTIVLGLLAAVAATDVARRAIRAADLKTDSLLYAVQYGWEAVTRALASSLREVVEIRGVWDRVPYLAVGCYRIERRTLLGVLHVLFAANAAIVVYALGQALLGWPVVFQPFFTRGTARLQGFFVHPNRVGGCVSMVLLVDVALTIYYDRRFAWYMPPLIAGLVLAGARSYVLAVLVCFAVIVALARSLAAASRYVAIAALTAVLAVVAVPWFGPRMLEGLEPSHNLYRLNFWRIAWATFLDHPVAGVGSGLLTTVLQPFAESGVVDNAAHAHSVYLQQLAENGAVGLVLALGVSGYFAVKYFRVFRDASDPLVAALGLGVALAWVDLLTAGFFEDNLELAIVAMNLNFLMGLVEGHRLAATPATVREGAGEPARCATSPPAPGCRAALPGSS